MELDQQRNYYNASHDSVGGLKFRVDPNPEIQRVIDTFAGITRDQYGKPLDKKNHALMNEEGVARCSGFLSGMVTRITHLSNYSSGHHINTQMKHYLRGWILVIVRNKKRWGIENKRIVIMEVEKLLHESMLRANNALEASLTAKSHQVSELVQHGQPQKKSFRGIFGGRERNEGE